jgi:hypothetical protein
MRDYDNQHVHGTDRDGKWSTSTVLMATFLGASVGFLLCHLLYDGMAFRQLTRIVE